jgi:hypothetical protein
MIVAVLAGAGTALAASRPTGPWGTTSQNFVRSTLTLPSGRQFDVQYARPQWRPAPLILMLPGLNETSAQLDSAAQALT